MDQNKKIILLIITLGAFLVLTYGINLPYGGQHDWNSVMYANIARNHLRYGLAKTKLGMVTNYGYFPNETFGYFTHYPPLMPIIVAVSFALFGITEWVGRLIPILSAVIMVYFTFKLVDALWDIKTAILSSIFLIFSPILLYYSKIPVHETVVLGFTAMTIWFYSQWLKTKDHKNFWLTLVGLVLCQLTSWAGFYLSAYLPLHAIIFQPKKFVSQNKLALSTLFLIAPTLFLAHNLHMYLLVGSKAQQSLWEGMLFRLNIGKIAQMYPFTWIEFIRRQALWISVYFTRVMSLLSFIWCLWFVSRRVKKIPVSLPESIIILLLIFGFTHNLVFRNLAYIHDYMLIYALPFFAISSAVTLNKIYTKFPPRSSIAIFLLIFVLLIFSTERLPYLQALFHSGDNNPGVSLGKAINRLSKPQESTLVLSTELMSFYDVFVRFYADRQVNQSDKLNPEDLKTYDFIVIPKSHDQVPSKDKELLYHNFPSIEFGGGIFFTITKKS